MYALTEELRIDATEAFTVRLESLTPQCHAYATVQRLRATVREPKRRNKQLYVVPFPHGHVPLITAEHLMLLNVVGSDSLFKALGADACEGGATPAELQLVPNFKSLKKDVQWTEYNVAGDFETRMKHLKAEYGTGYGFAVVSPAYEPTDGRVCCTAGWVWYGASATAPCTARGKVWFVDDGADRATLKGVSCSGRSSSAVPTLPKLLSVCTMYHQEDPSAAKPVMMRSPGTDVYSAQDTFGVLCAVRRPPPMVQAQKRAAQPAPPTRKPWLWPLAGAVALLLALCLAYTLSQRK